MFVALVVICSISPSVSVFISLCNKLSKPIIYNWLDILNGASSTATNYLTSEFNDILNNTTPDNQKLIYKIAKVISENS